MEVTILYGSETGNCESISKIVLDQTEETKINAKRITLNECNVAEASGTSGIWIIVTSSTGQGDPPENAVKFQRALLADEKPDLSNIKYTILGLGDTNYENYQGFPKRVEKLMKEAGAQEFYERGAADEAEGLEEVVEPWMENLWPVLIDLTHQ